MFTECRKHDSTILDLLPQTLLNEAAPTASERGSLRNDSEAVTVPSSCNRTSHKMKWYFKVLNWPGVGPPYDISRLMIHHTKHEKKGLGAP